MSTWISCTERMPAVDQQVVLANVNRMRSFDPHGCRKDVGVLSTMGGIPFWSTQGETRALSVEAFTHWMPLEEPSHD